MVHQTTGSKRIMIEKRLPGPIELSATAGLVSLTADAFGRVPKLSCRALQGEAHLSRIGCHYP
jgi:hypothetical protein